MKLNLGKPPLSTVSMVYSVPNISYLIFSAPHTHIEVTIFLTVIFVCFQKKNHPLVCHTFLGFKDYVYVTTCEHYSDKLGVICSTFHGSLRVFITKFKGFFQSNLFSNKLMEVEILILCNNQRRILSRAHSAQCHRPSFNAFLN